jgi:hypothetical protein
MVIEIHHHVGVDVRTLGGLTHRTLQRECAESVCAIFASLVVSI